MKVAVISTYFFDSTLPLAKNLSNYCDVDLYMLVYKGNRNAFVFELDKNEKNGLTDINKSKSDTKSIQKYLQGINCWLFVFPSRRIKGFVDLGMLLYLSLLLLIRRYNKIHIISQKPQFALLHLLFRNKIIQTFHEYDPKRLTDEKNKAHYLSIWPKKFIFHSQFVKECFPNPKNRNIRVIQYNIYETFLTNIRVEPSIKRLKKILFIGVIRPYKGVQLFIDICNKICKTYSDVKPVIAGRGDLSCYKNLDTKLFSVVNKDLTSDEFIQLINRSYLIICPYENASQSGVPMVAYSLLKPVVATNVGAFGEYIVGNHLICNSEDEILSIVEKLINDPGFYKSVQDKIAENYNSDQWKRIAEETFLFYNL